MDDSSSGRPSPRRQHQQLQGPRPAMLKVGKDSRKIRKPPVAPRALQVAAPAQLQQQQQQHGHRAPVIIYDASPKVIYTKPSEFMALVQRLTGHSSGVGVSSAVGFPEAAAAPFLPSPGAASGAISPAARYANLERSIRHDPGPAPVQFVNLIEEDEEDTGQAFPTAPAEPTPAPRPGILSPLPGTLPPISPAFFSPLSFDPSGLALLNDLSPFLSGAPGAGYGRGFDPFLVSPRNLLATPTMPSPAAFFDLFSQFPDL